jgi:hypothetical protein
LLFLPENRSGSGEGEARGFLSKMEYQNFILMEDPAAPEHENDKCRRNS